MKKRLLAGLLCLSLLWLAACADGTEEPPASEKGTVSSETVSLPNEESGADSPADANRTASSEAASQSGGDPGAENGHAADANRTASSEAASQSGGDPGAENGHAADANSTASSAAAPQEEEGEESMAQNVFTVTVNGAVFQADFADTTGAQALKELLAQGSLTIEMDDYAGFEKVGALGRSLPASDVQTTTQPGDIVLYQGSQIVLFYGINSWSYTRLGKIADLSGWEDALGSGSVSVTFALKK